MDAIDVQELRERLVSVRNKDFYNNNHALAWHGYLAALLEWGLISPEQHASLTDEMPRDDISIGKDNRAIDKTDPIMVIFLGTK
ncbi:hypothetical protein ACQ4M4_06970 [Leptolyngbya sp. AN02str]|uniref:hypothetical protein n=1 Tax=Leptolyngbya sp. AN02str TaxID=3423363 RepID=UPI003D31A80B